MTETQQPKEEYIASLQREVAWLIDKNKRLSLIKRPVMWRVMDDNIWRVFSDEKEAQDYAEKIGIGDYQGLYVRDGT